MLPTPHSAKPTSFIASYRSECPGGCPGVSRWGQDSWRPTLRPSRCPCVSRRGVAAHGESRPCLQLTPEATSCTIPDVQLFSMVPYILNVTAVQPWGSSSSFVPFVPEHITAVGAVGTPPVLALPRDLLTQVGPTEATSFTLRAVRPQAKYCIQVAAQDLTDYGEASDWSLPAAASKPLGK
ncbi:hypothetical protein GH733_003848 [Mirounga leonina]|nr:hypothetical protein GH733_003848 [Mirounga leonina]